MKKFKSLVLTVIGLLCSISMSAHDFVVDGIYYNITSSTDMTVAVTYRGNHYDSYSNEYSGAVNIPESVTYNGNTYSVTRISNDAFRGCSGLTSVEIGNSVTSIGDSAFKGCSGLTSVEIGNSVTSIGYSAFSHCSGLTSVEIGNSVTSIGDDAFSSCSSLTSVEIGHSVTNIGEDAFWGCSGLTSVEIPNSVTRLGSYAFYNCSGLTSVHINDIAAWCNIEFGDNTANPLCYARNLYLNGEKVTELVIPNGVTSIGDDAFYGCSSLTSVEIGNSVTSIGKHAFNDCYGLTSVEIGNSVTSIGDSAFKGCSGLTSVEIGNSVTSIGSSAFSGCTNLLSITLGNSIELLPGSWSDLQLRTIICLNPNAVEIFQGTFSMNTFNHAVVYVPEDSYWNYAYSNWGAFIHIKEIVTEANSLQSRKAYMIADSKGTNFKVYDAERDALKNVEYTHALDEESEDCCWTVMKENGKTYLFNLGAKKFGVVGNNGAITLSETPVHVAISETEGGLSLNGNNCMFVLNKHVEVDATGISDVLLNGQDTKNAQIHSLDGRRQQTLKRGVNIVNGKKVFVQ